MGICIRFLQKCAKCFRSVLIYCATLCFLSTILPPTLFILLPFFIYKQIVIGVATLRGLQMGKVLASRSIPAASEDLYENPRMTIVLGIICEKPEQEAVNLEFIRETLQKQAIEARNENGGLKYPELQQNVGNFLGYMFWKPVANFKIKEHISYFNNSANSEMQQYELSYNLRKLALKPFSREKALWEFILVPKFHYEEEQKNLTSNNFLLIFRCHHCLGDGVSVLKLFDKFTTKKKVVMMPYFDTPPTSCFARWTRIILKLPYDLGSQMFNRTTKFRNMWDNKLSSDSKRKIVDDTFSGAISQEIPFSQIKEISLQHGISSTTVIFSAVASSIRNFMLKSCESRKLPKDISLHINLPLPGRKDKLRNDAMVATLSLPIQEEDPIKRLRTIDERLRKLKSSTVMTFSVAVIAMLSVLPSFIIKRVMKSVYKEHKAFFTNFPGPLEPIDMFGYNVLRFHFACGMVKSSNTLGLAFGSYAGKVAFSVAADERLLGTSEDAKELIGDFFKELEIIKNNTLDTVI